MQRIVAALAAFFMFASGVMAHGIYPPIPPVVAPPVVVPPPPPVVVPAAPPAAAAPAPAPGPGSSSPMFKIVPLLIGALAVFIVYCLSTEDERYCQREEEPHAWPGP